MPKGEKELCVFEKVHVAVSVSARRRVLRKHRCVAVNGVEFLRFEVERSNLGLGGEDPSMKLEYLSLTRFGKSQCMAEDLDSRDSLDLVAGSVISPHLPIFEVRRISAAHVYNKDASAASSSLLHRLCIYRVLPVE